MKIFDPNQRCVLADALRSPPGFVFDLGVGTTYSLHPTTLLAVPFHLACFAQDDADALKDPVALLEALRRVSDRLTLFAEEGRIHAPGSSHVLYGLLEDLIVEAKAPKNGAFHAKLWILRFTPVGEGGEPLIRLILPTRNVTPDRSWDLSLVLDGHPGRRNVAANRELFELVSRLPSFARRKLAGRRTKAVLQLAEEVRRVKWELPEGFESVRFHAPGLLWERWLPSPSEQMLVISPFAGNEALRELQATTNRPVALVSRAETLEQLDPGVLEAFESVFVLHDAAETEDGEDEAEGLHGLHAKAYVAKKGWKSHIYVGSANATDAALLLGRNIEILAELVAGWKRVGKPEEFLHSEGFRDLLTEYIPSEQPPERDPAEVAAEKALDDARRELVHARLEVDCQSFDERWRMDLKAKASLRLSGIKKIVWGPISLSEARWEDAGALRQGGVCSSPLLATHSVTGLVGFALTAEIAPKEERFVLNLPLLNRPEDRDAEVMGMVIKNRDGFLRYLLMLLEEEGGKEGGLAHWKNRGGYGSPLDFDDGRPLLEELVRALHRTPENLHAVKRFVDSLLASSRSRDMVPPRFLEIWSVFEEVLKEEGRA